MPGSPAKPFTSTAASPRDPSLDPPRGAEEVLAAIRKQAERIRHGEPPEYGSPHTPPLQLGRPPGSRSLT